jgi:hypothetical protein
MLRHDLWAVFDWSVAQSSFANNQPQYRKGKQELQVRLAEVLRRLALTPDEIKSLPDNYAQAVASGTFGEQYAPGQPQEPFLPPDLFDPHGRWVCIQPSPESDAGVAVMHVQNFSGRSSFLVFVRLPAGRKVTVDYFESLWNFPEPYLPGPSFSADQAPHQSRSAFVSCGNSSSARAARNTYRQSGQSGGLFHYRKRKSACIARLQPQRSATSAVGIWLTSSGTAGRISSSLNSAAHFCSQGKTGACGLSVERKRSFPFFRLRVTTQSKAPTECPICRLSPNCKPVCVATTVAVCVRSIAEPAC